MSKILLYEENSTGVTTNETQYAFYINENGLPTVKNGSETITFGTSGYAFAGSSGSSGASGSSGSNGTNGISGTSGQDGAPGDTGSAGNNGTSGVSGTAGINGVDGGGGTAGSSGLSYGSSGTSGASGSAGSSGSSGATGSTGSSGATGSSGSSGASLASLYEEPVYTLGSGVALGSNSYSTDSVVTFIQSATGALPITTYDQVFLDGFNDSTFANYANSYINAGESIRTFLSGKKLKSLKINRTSNYSPTPTGKTECTTVSAYLKIYKANVGDSYPVTYSVVKTIDLNGLINFNVSGSTTTQTIDLSTDNLQTAYNEFFYVQIERTIELCNSTSKFVNLPGISMFFETVASGILGTNGTAGSSGVSGSAGSSGLSFGSSGTSGATGSSGSSGGTGASGSSGSSGATGSSGAGVPTGGTAGQVLAKVDGTNYNTQWVNQSGGGGTGMTLNSFWSQMVDDLDPHPGDGGSLIPYQIRITADALYKTVVTIVDSANTVLKTVYTGTTAPNPPTIPLTSIVAWYKADAGISSSSGQITAWADQSGNDYHLEAPAGKEPNYSGTTLNGILIPDTIAGWTSSLDRRLRSTTTVPGVGETGTIFIVGAQYAGETFYNLFLDYNTTSGYQICRDANEDTILGGFGQDPFPYGSQVAATNGTFYTIRSVGNGTTSQLTLNGTITGTTFTDGSPSGTAYLNIFNSDANRPGKKAIAEILIYADALSAGDIAEIELYLRNKWGHY